MLYQNVATGLVVYPQVIAKHLREELPFMATENILMAAVAAGGDRQELHERIRQHSQAAAAVVKQQGGANDLIARLKATSFAAADIDAAIDPAKLTGRSKEQVDEFLAEIVAPIRSAVRQIGIERGSSRVDDSPTRGRTPGSPLNQIQRRLPPMPLAAAVAANAGDR